MICFHNDKPSIMVRHLTAFCLIMALFACKSNHHLPAIANEPHRPLYHFTPPSKWMNDPNGLVYYQGEYHLFYQHYPEASVWGPMHWGHAVSRDLIHWEHLPIALYPDSLGLIFSGSAVVDWNNTSGLGKDGKPPLVAMFTHHLMEGEKAGRSDFQYQSIAYSNDKGRTWTKYKGNPVVPNTEKIKDFRDPKVTWDKERKQWLLVFAAKDQTKFWSSPDLIHWKFLSNFGKTIGGHGGVWECPDFFPITVEGTQEKKWVLLQSINPGGPNGGSATQYFIGNFDGKQFTLDPEFAQSVKDGKGVWLDWGRDNYAGVTWSDIPASDGRRIFIGWMSNWDYAAVVPTTNWRSANTIPRELTLQKTASGLRLFSQPIRETAALRGKKQAITNQKVAGNFDLTNPAKYSPSSMEMLIDAELSANTGADFAVVLSNARGENYRIGYANQQFYSDRTKAGNHDFSNNFGAKVDTAPGTVTGNHLKMHLFFDRASCEMFANDGENVMTTIFFPTEDFTQVKLVAKNGTVLVKSLDIYPLK
jgi:fructan beta-fructosidase